MRHNSPSSKHPAQSSADLCRETFQAIHIVIKGDSDGEAPTSDVKYGLERVVDATSVPQSIISGGRYPVRGLELPEALCQAV